VRREPENINGFQAICVFKLKVDNENFSCWREKDVAVEYINNKKKRMMKTRYEKCFCVLVCTLSSMLST
jgi:hypothetical protein